MREPSALADHFAWYRRALAGEQVEYHDGDWHCGYFWMRRSRNGPRIGVAIWIDQPLDPETNKLTGDEAVMCLVGHRTDHQVYDDPARLWASIAKRPVPYDDYRAYYETGEWPDDKAPGPNFAEGDEYEALIDQITAAVAAAREIAAIENQGTADKAANLRDRLNRLADEAERKRVELKRPHDEAAKAVQARWKPLVDTAKAGADGLRPKLTAYMTAKEQEAVAAAAETQAAAPKPIRAGGAHGKRTGLRTQVHVEITDYIAALAAVQNEREVREAVETVVRRIVRAGGTVPGVEKREERVAA